MDAERFLNIGLVVLIVILGILIVVLNAGHGGGITHGPNCPCNKTREF